MSKLVPADEYSHTLISFELPVRLQSVYPGQHVLRLWMVPSVLETGDVAEVWNSRIIIFFVVFLTELFDPVCYCRIGLLLGEDAHRSEAW
jgi:hypothetical protein